MLKIGENEELIFGKELVRSLRWFVKQRWLASVSVLLLIITAKYGFQLPLPYPQLVIGTVVLFLFNSWFDWYLRNHNLRKHRKKTWVIANTQIVFDFVILTYFLHFSGGIENPFLFYFIFHMIIASILLSTRATYAQATFAVVIFGLMTGAEYFNILEHYHSAFLFREELYSKLSYVSSIFGVFVSTLYISIFIATSIVNQLRKREKQLSIMNQRLKKQDRLRSEYILQLSYDIQIPLKKISTDLEEVFSEPGTNLSPQIQILKKTIQNRTGGLIKFVQTLFDLAEMRIQTNLEKQRIPLSELIESIAKQLMPQANEKGVHLIIENFTRGAYLTVDPQLLTSIIFNLVINAIKYTPSGGRISIQTREIEENFQLLISDTGIGIAAQDLPRIFDDFYRAPNAKKVKIEGTGLGMSVVKHLVESHGGKIWVESEVNQGTQIYFQIPKIEVQPNANE